jgi:hypothetical protein
MTNPSKERIIPVLSIRQEERVKENTPDEEVNRDSKSPVSIFLLISILMSGLGKKKKKIPGEGRNR